jgi:RNA polymerase sigma factor (sigma-70 family)
MLANPVRDEATRMSNPAEVAGAGAEDSPKSSFSDTQLAAFWASILLHQDAARVMARRFVPKHTVEDAVMTAAIKFLESFHRDSKPAVYPSTEQDFRQRFLAIVRNHAIDCVRGTEVVERPVHAHWGKELEPKFGGRKIADQPLDQVFVRNDKEEHDAPAPAETRDKDTTDALDQILRGHLADLSRMQRQVVLDTFLEGHKRAESARRLGIRVKTYDSHLQAAFRKLRHLLSIDADTYTEVDRSVWYDLVEELRERYEASRIRDVASKSRSLSTSTGERSNSTGVAGKSARSDAA